MFFYWYYKCNHKRFFLGHWDTISFNMTPFLLDTSHILNNFFFCSWSNLCYLSWFPCFSHFFHILEFAFLVVLCSAPVTYFIFLKGFCPFTEPLFYCQWLVILLLSLLKDTFYFSTTLHLLQALVVIITLRVYPL